MIFIYKNHFQSFHSLPILNTFSIKWVSFTRLSSSSTSSFLFHGKRFQGRRDSCWKRKQKGFLWFKEGHSFNAMSVNPFWTAGQTIIRNNHQLLRQFRGVFQNRCLLHTMYLFEVEIFRTYTQNGARIVRCIIHYMVHCHFRIGHVWWWNEKISLNVYSQ